MFMVVLAWLGVSAIWLVPFIVLLLVQAMQADSTTRRAGTLRFWAGAWLSYAASACLEALCTAGLTAGPHGGWLGGLLANSLSHAVGRPLGLLVAGVALAAALWCYWQGARTRLAGLPDTDAGRAKGRTTRAERTRPAHTSVDVLANGIGRNAPPRAWVAPGTGRRSASGPVPRYKKPVVTSAGSSAQPFVSTTRSVARTAPVAPKLTPTPTPTPTPRPSSRQSVTTHSAMTQPAATQAATQPFAISQPVPQAAVSAPHHPADTRTDTRTAVSGPTPAQRAAAALRESLLANLRTTSLQELPASLPELYEPVPVPVGTPAIPLVPDHMQATLDAINRRVSQWPALSLGDSGAEAGEDELLLSTRSSAAAADSLAAITTGAALDNGLARQAAAPTDAAGATLPSETSGVRGATAAAFETSAQQPTVTAPLAPASSYAEVDADASEEAATAEFDADISEATTTNEFENSATPAPASVDPFTRTIPLAERVAPAWELAANEPIAPAEQLADSAAHPVTHPSANPAAHLAGEAAIASTDAQGFAASRHAPNPVAPAVVSPAPVSDGFKFVAPLPRHIELPPLSLLARALAQTESVSAQALYEKGQLIEQRLKEFKVPVSVIGADAGPVITRFEIEPAVGVRGSQIVGLMKDLSRALGVTSVRVVETIPGKTCMGLELPNVRRDTIRLAEILESDAYRNHSSYLTLAMGKDITGNPVVADLARAPHMLVAGTTGSGKSVAINAMILSLLYKATPEDVRLIMIDPKMLELSVYEGIPHLLAPVVTDMKLAAHALNWCVGEMERRYRLLSALGVRNLAGYNQKIRQAQQAGSYLTNPFSLTPEAPEPLSSLPLIVVVIDELADLMMVAGKKIEELIARLAQKARAAGIHLILATQRPSVDVITGLIKANIPTRVAFQVSSKIDSRTILDQMGAESLLGQGDMLFLPPGTGYPQRVHGAFVADEEVHQVVEYLKQFGEPEYEESILAGPPGEGGAQDLFGDTPEVEADPLYDEAVAFVLRSRRASISSVQRQFRIGYNRAARLVEQMESAGLVSSMSHGGTREVLVPGPQE